MKYASVTLKESVLVPSHNGPPKILNKFVDPEKLKDNIVLEDCEYGILYKVVGLPTTLIPWDMIRQAAHFPVEALKTVPQTPRTIPKAPTKAATPKAKAKAKGKVKW